MSLVILLGLNKKILKYILAFWTWFESSKSVHANGQVIPEDKKSYVGIISKSIHGKNNYYIPQYPGVPQTVLVCTDPFMILERPKSAERKVYIKHKYLNT